MSCTEIGAAARFLACTVVVFHEHAQRGRYLQPHASSSGASGARHTPGGKTRVTGAICSSLAPDAVRNAAASALTPRDGGTSGAPVLSRSDAASGWTWLDRRPLRLEAAGCDGSSVACCLPMLSVSEQPRRSYLCGRSKPPCVLAGRPIIRGCAVARWTLCRCLVTKCAPL